MCQHCFQRGKHYYCGLFFPPTSQLLVCKQEWNANCRPQCCRKLVMKYNVNPVSSCALSDLTCLLCFHLPAWKVGWTFLRLPSAVNCAKLVLPLWTTTQCQAWGGLLLPYWVLQWKLLNKFWFLFFFSNWNKQFFSYWWKYDLKLSNQ